MSKHQNENYPLTEESVVNATLIDNDIAGASHLGAEISNDTARPEVIGQGVVNAALSEAAYAVSADVYHAKSDAAQLLKSERDAATERKVSSLAQVRERLASLSYDEKSKLNDYLNNYDAPFIASRYDDNSNKRFREYRKSNDTFPDLSWSHWLAAEASDGQLTNFLQWHVHALSEQAKSPETEGVIRAEKETYKEAVQMAILDGWLHPDAIEAIQKIDDIDVLVGDLFDTLLFGVGGYHQTGADYVVIAQGLGHNKQSQLRDLRRNLREALAHEFNHAVLGELGETWLNEALTEHIARSLGYGQIDVVNPAEREEDGTLGAYVARRELLDAMLTGGAKSIPVELATQLYSQHVEDKILGDSQLNNELEESWGSVGPISSISFHVWHLEQVYINEGMSRMQAQEKAARVARSDLLQQPEVVFY